MLILSLEKQKKHLTALCLENGERVLLDTQICLENGLTAGTDISEEQFKQLRHASEYRRARERALWYLDRADRTQKEIYKKLCTAGFEEKIAAEVVARLTEVEVLNDRRFAERFAERCRESGISPRETVRRLYEKGISGDLAREVAATSADDEEARVLAVIEKKYARKLCEEGGTEKVYAALARRGFSFSVIKTVLKKYSEELEYSEE